MEQKIECFIFYFDVIGVVDEYLHNPDVLTRLCDWQRDVRSKFTFAHYDTTCKTLFDNIWARITSNHPESDIYTILDFAGETMKLAKDYGFHKYFGAITYGAHSYDIFDRTLVGGGNPTDIIKQHIDTLGPAHIRAAFAEKWSADLFKNKIHPALNSIWVSEEALFGLGSLRDVILGSGLDCQYVALETKIDLNDSKYSEIRKWPFDESSFQFIVSK